MVSRLLADIDYLEEASTELSKRIEELLAPFAATVERLITIPGVQRERRKPPLLIETMRRADRSIVTT